MSPASSDASMLAVAVPAPLCPTLLAVHSCTRQHANLLVPGQIVSGLVVEHHADGAATPMVGVVRHRQVEANRISIHVVEAAPESSLDPAVLFVHGFPELWYSVAPPDRGTSPSAATAASRPTSGAAAAPLSHPRCRRGLCGGWGGGEVVRG
jgi:hypothetical protein